VVSQVREPQPGVVEVVVAVESLALGREDLEELAQSARLRALRRLDRRDLPVDGVQ